MARSKTARQKKAKRRTMRKPRTALRVTNNNLNLNEDPNVRYELMESYANRQEYKAEQEARAKYDAVPKDTFRFVIKYYDGEEDEEWLTINTRPMPRGDTRKLPIRAMDFLKMMPEDERHLEHMMIGEMKIFYKGVEPDDTYYYLVKHTVSGFYNSEPNNSNSNDDFWDGYQYRRIFRPQHNWLVYFMDPMDFFRNQYYIPLPSDPPIVFHSWYSTVRFIRNLPHLEEKAEREESALRTWRESILRHQRRVVEPMAAKFMKKTKQVVPENVEHIIRSFI